MTRRGLYAESVIKKYGDGPEAAAATRTLLSLDVREGKTADVERRGFAILRGEVKGSTLDQRQSAGPPAGEYLLSVGQVSARGGGVRSGVSHHARAARTESTCRGAWPSRPFEPATAPAAITQLRQVRKLKLDSETDRATSYWLAFALDGSGAHRRSAAVMDRARPALSHSATTARRRRRSSASPDPPLR